MDWPEPGKTVMEMRKTDFRLSPIHVANVAKLRPKPLILLRGRSGRTRTLGPLINSNRTASQQAHEPLSPRRSMAGVARAFSTTTFVQKKWKGARSLGSTTLRIGD
jgi:hypothetical protein